MALAHVKATRLAIYSAPDEKNKIFVKGRWKKNVTKNWIETWLRRSGIRLDHPTRALVQKTQGMGL